MAIVIANLRKKGGPGGLPDTGRVEFDITLDDDYPTGGYAITPAQGGFANDLDSILPGIAVNSGNCLLVGWNEATNKLMVFYPTGGGAAGPAIPAQPAMSGGVLSGAPGGGVLSGSPAVGTLAVASGAATASAVDATTPTIGGAPSVGTLAVSAPTVGTLAVSGISLTPGAGKEVPNGADLAGYTVHCLAWGN